jgi:hypothetical protein
MLMCIGSPRVIPETICSSKTLMACAHWFVEIPLLHFIGFIVLVETLLSLKVLLHTLHDSSESKCHA